MISRCGLRIAKPIYGKLLLAPARIVRYFSDEPDYMVKSDITADPKTIHVSFLRDNVRQEIYKLHKEDPKLWTVSKLAQKYGMTLERSKAVIYLMRKREDLMRDEKVLDIPSQWNEIYEKHQTDPNINTLTSLANEYSLSESSISDIITRLSTHYSRLNLVQQHEQYWNEAFQEFEEFGINTNFRETPTESKSSQTEYYPELFGDDDYEEMKTKLKRRIQQETRVKQTLIEKDETTALHSIFNKYNDIKPFNESSTDPIDLSPDITQSPSLIDIAPISIQEQREQQYQLHYASILIPFAQREIDEEKLRSSTSLQSLTQQTSSDPNVQTATSTLELDPRFCRWKFAFRDLSRTGQEMELNRRQRRANRGRDSFVAPIAPTLICTRQGKLRVATLLEESGRSWSRKPRHIDIALYENTPEYKALKDPDNDEELVIKKKEQKKEKRKKLKNANIVNG